MEDIIGMIKLFAGSYAPQGWAFCDGSLLPIRQYTALFSILGNNYGGDGKVTFALPDLRGRAAAGGGMGQNPRWPNLNLEVGESDGENNVTLISSEMPTHMHSGAVNAVETQANSTTPQGNMLAQPYASYTGEAIDFTAYTPSGTGTAVKPFGILTVQIAGGSQPHSNMQPYLGMNYIICMEGIFPQRP